MAGNNHFPSIAEQTDDKENVFITPARFIPMTKADRMKQAGLFPIEKQTKLELSDDRLGWRIPTGLTQMPQKRSAEDDGEMKETPAEKRKRLKKEEESMAREMQGMLANDDKKTDNKNKRWDPPVKQEPEDFVDLTTSDEICSTESYADNRSEAAADGDDYLPEEADPQSHMFRATRLRWNGDSPELWLDEEFTNRVLDGFWAFASRRN